MKRLQSLGLAVVAVPVILLFIEIPALLGWVDYCFTVGTAERVDIAHYQP